jgi:hypothetical protein
MGITMEVQDFIKTEGIRMTGIKEEASFSISRKIPQTKEAVGRQSLL